MKPLDYPLDYKLPFFIIITILFLFHNPSEVSANVHVCPEEYGAKADGKTDDTEAFEKAVASGNDIYLSGSYCIRDLKLLPGQKIFGSSDCRLIYHYIELNDRCSMSSITLDGLWHTKGVAILGSNVLVSKCSFLNTKGTLENFDGLTSTIWIGTYKDLEDDEIRYNNITIKDCLFDGCEPYDKVARVSSNRTAARNILSYGCSNLKIIGCSFINMKGCYDADYIHIRSHEVPSTDFPFFDFSKNWSGSNPPFFGYYYAAAKTIIRNCSFQQSGCKSCVKIMASNVIIENNNFLFDNWGITEESYSIVRVHRSKDVSIVKNSIALKSGNINNVFRVDNGTSIFVQKNTIYGEAYCRLESYISCVYSDKSICKNNVFRGGHTESLLETEFNGQINIVGNFFEPSTINLRYIYSQQPNHYVYPSTEKDKSTFKKNKITIQAEEDLVIYPQNKYDYVVEFSGNKFRTPNMSHRIVLDELYD